MADNTIANAIKFLKGEEKSLPAAKTEGQVYFAYKNVGTAEKPSYTGAIYIDTPIGGTQNRIKMTANADIADKAFNDSAGLSIRDTYLSSLGYTDDGKQTILIKGSGNNQTRIALPIASTTKSGIVTTDAQSFGGTKTFTTINSTNLTITGTSGFNYSGIETATESKARPIWFADSSVNGKPVINTNFTYNPVTQTLKVLNLSGTADKANKDSAGNDIRSTYISNITINNDIMTITKGSGATSTLSIKDKLYSGAMMATKEDLDKFIEANVFKFGHINAIEGYNGLEKNDGIILSASWKSNTNSAHQIFIDDSGYALRHRYRNDGNWSDWASILDSTNYNSYAPTKAGGGAYGTWDINILGNAASANKLNTNAGSATFPVYFSNGVPVACSTNLAVNITGNAASANKLNTNAGSATRPIYFSGGIPIQCDDTLASSITGSAYRLFIGPPEDKKAGGLYMFQKYEDTNFCPTDDWWSILRTQHPGYDNGYWQEMAYNFHNDRICFRRNVNGTKTPWKNIAFTDSDITGKSASTDALNWTHGNEIRFTKPNYTEPQTLHFAYAWADGSQSKLINDYRFNNGNGYDLAQVTASQFNGNLNGNANTASNLNGINTILSTGIENSAITIKTNNNGIFTLVNNCSLRNAIDFRWYGTNWQIGNIRGNSTDSIGFGFAFSSDGGDTFALKSYIDTNGYYHGGVVGNANTATALTSSAGSSTQPIYFNGGKPVACTYTLSKSVPADAKFTDTWRGIQNNVTSDSTTDSLSAAQGKYLKGLIDNKLSLSGGRMTGDIGLPSAPSTIDGSVPYAGSTVITDNIATFSSYKTYLGTYMNSEGSWRNIISIRHRNGANDGINYGMMIYTALTGADSLRWNKQTGEKSWQGERIILDSSNYTSYTVTKTGSGASGTWGINVSGSSTSCSGNAASATTISSMTPTLSTGIEKSAITVKTNNNAVFPITNVAKMSSIRTAIDFQWYDSNWQIGNIRSDDVNSVGFGFAFKPSANGTLALKSYIDTNGVYHGNVAGSAGSVAWGNVTGKPSSFNPSSHTHNYLPLSGGTMTGNINFNYNSVGVNYIGNGANDNTYMVGGALNNLVISSWWGISFTTSSSSAFLNKNAVSIDCRNGVLAAVSLRVGNGSGSTINFCTNGGTANPGAKIVAYNDRIEFVFG